MSLSSTAQGARPRATGRPDRAASVAPDREAHAGLRGRRIGLAALSLAGALWLANVALGTGGEHTYAQSTLDYVEVLAYSAALLGLVPALLVLRSWDQRRSGRLGAIALFSAGAGAAIAAAANFGEDALGVKALGDSVYFPAVLVLMLGLLLLGVALLRAPAPWRWIAAWPLATLVAFLAAGNAAGFIVGPLWIALGALLWVRRGPFRAWPA